MKAIFCYKLKNSKEYGYINTSLKRDGLVSDIDADIYDEIHEKLIPIIKERLHDTVEIEPISCNEYLAMTDEGQGE